MLIFASFVLVCELATASILKQDSEVASASCQSFFDTYPSAGLGMRDLTFRCLLELDVFKVDITSCTDAIGLMENLKWNPFVWVIFASWLNQEGPHTSESTAVGLVKLFRRYPPAIQVKIVRYCQTVVQKKSEGDEIPSVMDLTDQEMAELTALYADRSLSNSELLHNALYSSRWPLNHLSIEDATAAAVELIRNEFSNDFAVCARLFKPFTAQDLLPRCTNAMAKFRALDHESKHMIAVACAPVLQQ